MYPFLLALLLILTPSLLWAGTVEVSPGQSIQGAVNQAGSGGTTIVHAGTYTEDGIRLPNGAEGNPTVLKAGPGETVNLQGTGASDCFICLSPGAAWQTIDGFHFDGKGVTTYVLNSGDRSQDFHHITIQNSELTGTRQSCILVNGDTFTVQNNDIHHCGIQQDHDHGVYFSVHQSLLKNNFIHDAQCFGAQISSDYDFNLDNNVVDGNTFTNNGCAAMSLIYGSNETFINNVVYEDALGNSRGVTPGALICCKPGTIVEHNTFVSNHSKGIGSYNGAGDVQPGVQIRNNIVCNNSGGDIDLQTEAGNTSDNITGSCPTYVDPSKGDYRMTAAHPVPCLSAVPLDKNGTPRAPNCDAGAFQFGTTDGTVPPSLASIPVSPPTLANSAPPPSLSGTAPSPSLGIRNGGAVTPASPPPTYRNRVLPAPLNLRIVH